VALPPFCSSIVGWPRAGELTEAELEASAAELTESSTPTSVQAIRTAIENAAHVEPLESDVANVRPHLAAGGWPLEPLRTQEARGAWDGDRPSGYAVS
jgi:hypothetical protein